MTVLEIRNLDPERLRGYLVDGFGGTATGDTVQGAGWRVRFVPMPPSAVGRFHVRTLRLEVEGEREAEAAAFLRRMTMRGGG